MREDGFVFKPLPAQLCRGCDNCFYHRLFLRTLNRSVNLFEHQISSWFWGIQVVVVFEGLLDTVSAPSHTPCKESKINKCLDWNMVCVWWDTHTKWEDRLHSLDKRSEGRQELPMIKIDGFKDSQVRRKRILLFYSKHLDLISKVYAKWELAVITNVRNSQVRHYDTWVPLRPKSKQIYDLD